MNIDVCWCQNCRTLFSTHELVLTVFCPSIQYKPPTELNTEMFNFLTFEKFSSQSQFTLGGPQTKTFMDCILFDQLMVNLINTVKQFFFCQWTMEKWLGLNFRFWKECVNRYSVGLFSFFESMDKYIIDNWVSCTGSLSVKQCCIFKFYKFYIPSYTKFAFLYSVFLFCSKVDKSRVTFQYLNRNRFIHNQTVKVECWYQNDYLVY